jgi:hydroxylamine dehydrogenase
MRLRQLLTTACLAAAFVLAGGLTVTANADIPRELYKNLGIDKSASPKDLYNKLRERYRDPEQGAGKGKFGKYWEPIPMSKYYDPLTFYEPPASVKEVAGPKECVECHTEETPGAVAAWHKSVHSNLDEIRNLPDSDSRAYKKELLEKVEGNLRSLGKLGANENLKQVNCIDCHVGVGAKKADHRKDLRLPTADVCGTCHLTEFAERESERDTMDWPHGQWPNGRPSHALDYRANVETAIYAGMEEREVADGCTACHINQNKCDTCHTRHQFSAAESRKPQACANCHNGVDHNEYENYMMSKHGAIYQTLSADWDWEVPLKDAVKKGGQTAPTCAGCHMEYKGRYGHNVVRKVRWAFNPTPAIADNLDHEWFQGRREAWVTTCTKCHSESFARAYLDQVDNGIKSGLKYEQAAKKVVQKLYDDGLLPGQKDNRPAPPAPEKDAMGAFYGLFWAKGNNPSAVEREYTEMWEHDIIKLYKGMAHINPGNYTYSNGWAPLVGRYTAIQDANTELREKAELKARVAKLEKMQKADLLTPDSFVKKASLGGVGTGMVLVGGLALWGWRRRRLHGDAEDGS